MSWPVSIIYVRVEALLDGWRVSDDGGDLEPTTFDDPEEAESDAHDRRHYYEILRDVEVEVIGVEDSE